MNTDTIRLIANTVPGIMYLIDARLQRYLFVNSASERILGLKPDEMIRMGPAGILERMHPDDRERVLKKHMEAVERINLVPDAEQLEYVHEDDYRLMHRDGRLRWLRSSSVVFERAPNNEILTILGIAIDISEQKESEAQLRISERLASAGLLAAEIAHEINNPLAFVSMSLDMAIDRLKVSASAKDIEEVTEILTKAGKNTKRISKIVLDLKTFSRPDDEKVEWVSLHDAIEAALSVVERDIREKGELVVEYGEIPHVLANHGRLSQIFLNLLVNASQALPGGKAGDQVRVSTRLSDDRSTVIAEVHDTGPGISAENRQHVFDPFFTTKPIGIGTGLGLTICRNIVKSLGGEITVQSEPGKGTTFRVTFKAAPV